uniref:rRNA-processing protein FCF1 homolog n=2 Tax=Magallana gigas TaxID=29159 RepID=K1RKL9_MAGGI
MSLLFSFTLLVTWAIDQKSEDNLKRELKRVGVSFRMWEERGDDKLNTKVRKWSQPTGDDLRKIIRDVQIHHILDNKKDRHYVSIESLSVQQLRDELTNRQLSKKGKKPELVARLKDAVGNNTKMRRNVGSRLQVSYDFSEDEEQDLDVAALQDLWSGFHTLMESLRALPGTDNYKDMETFAKEAKEWATEFRKQTFDEDGKGKTKAAKTYAAMKRMINLKDSRIKYEERQKKKRKSKKPNPENITERNLPQASSAMFFKYNTQLGPPYHIIVDTNFINFSIKNKLEIIQSMMDCLYAKCIPYITDCVMGELEKLGSKYRVALRIARDPRFKRLPCLHKGTYADDCIVQRITQHKCYIVATCDKDLRRRIRKIPGVPIMYLQQHRYSIERMPDAFGAPKT